jgi:hypothetical protein
MKDIVVTQEENGGASRRPSQLVAVAILKAK